MAPTRYLSSPNLLLSQQKKGVFHFLISALHRKTGINSSSEKHQQLRFLRPSKRLKKLFGIVRLNFVSEKEKNFTDILNYWELGSARGVGVACSFTETEVPGSILNTNFPFISLRHLSWTSGASLISSLSLSFISCTVC